MPRLSLGLGAQSQRKVGGSQIPKSGLSLWLKADAGVTTTPETYVSQVVLSGAGTTTSNGTYTRASGGSTTFNGPNGNSISFTGGAEWELYDTQLYNPDTESYGAISYYTEDFQSWSTSPLGEAPVPSGAVTNTPTGTLFVTGWADQSGNARNASEYSGSFPTYSLIGGKSFVSFTAFVDLLVSNVIWGASIPFIGTIFTVARFPLSSNGGNARLFSAEANTNYFVFGRGIESTNVFFVTNNQEDYLTSVSAINNNTNYILETTFDENDAAIYLNGTLAGDSSVFSNTGVGSELIGGGEDPSSIAEMIVYNRVLTTPERQQVEAYLNAKYAIY